VRPVRATERIDDHVVWHDLECGRYAEDLPLWRELAAHQAGPVLDVGAGSGRVALDLARHGHEVTALDCDELLIGELARRAGSLPVRALTADARAFSLEERFGLCLAPMQTVQLLGGPPGRLAFLRCARRCLRPGGRLAAAIVEQVECYEEQEGVPGPLPDVLERDGTLYFSQPTAVRRRPEGFVLERRRERIDTRGGRAVEENRITIDLLSAEVLEAEALCAGLTPAGRVEIASTDEHVGSMVVMLDA